jgi:hypothetical protein
MTDEITNSGRGDLGRINLQEAGELRYWTSKYGCTEAQLREGVRAEGVVPTEVEAYLRIWQLI